MLQAQHYKKWLVAISVTLGTLMGTIDVTIVSVAIPHIRGSIGASIQEITWVTTSFLIASVSVMGLAAFLARHLGQKRVYLGALVLFIISSLLCGMSRSLLALAIFRFFQGAGSGLLIPLEQSILRQAFPENEQGIAAAIFGFAIMLGPSIGPTLGGFIVDSYPWYYVFYINLPIGIIGFWMVLTHVEDQEDFIASNQVLVQQERRRMDWPGMVSFFIGLAALQYALEEGNRNEWLESQKIYICLSVASASLTAFIFRELTISTPAIDLRLFRDPVFLSGTIVTALMNMVLTATLFLIPVYMQELLGFTAMQTGLASLPRAMVMAIFIPLLGKYHNILPSRIILVAGFLTFGWSCYSLSTLNLETDFFRISIALAAQGIGLSGIHVTLSTMTLSQVPRHKLADASALNVLMRLTGGSIGLAVFTALLSNYTSAARSNLFSLVNSGRPEVLGYLYQAEQIVKPIAQEQGGPTTVALRVFRDIAERQSLLLAFNKVFMLAAILFICLVPITLLLRSRKNVPT